MADTAPRPFPHWLREFNALGFEEAAANAGNTAVVAHVNQSDPHPQYQLRSAKGFANGYPSLDPNGRLPAAQLPSSIPAATIAFVNAGFSAATAHDALVELYATKQAVAAKGQAGGYAGLDAQGRVPLDQLPESLGGSIAFADVTGVPGDNAALALALGLLQPLSAKGQPNGYAALDATGKVPSEQIPAEVGGSPTWGGIVGNIPDQADLQALLDDKADTTHAHAIADVDGLQAALNGKQASDPTLTALAGVATAADKLIYAVGVDVFATTDLTVAGRALLDDANATAQRATLGLGALATLSSIATGSLDAKAVTYAKMQDVGATDRLLGRSSAGAGTVEEIACTAAGRALLDDVDAAAQRATLGLGSLATKSQIAVGDVPNDLITYAKLQNVSAADKLLGRVTAGAGDVEEIACTAAGRALLDDADAAAQRATLGLGALATKATAATADIADAAVTYQKMQATSGTDKLLGRASAGGGLIEEIACTAAGRALLDDADAAAQRATLGVHLWSAMVEIDNPTAGTAYTIVQKHGQALTVTSVIVQALGASAGTLNVRAAGTTIAGLGSVNVTTGETDTAPTGGEQTVNAGQKIDVVPSGITGVTRLTITVRGTK